MDAETEKKMDLMEKVQMSRKSPTGGNDFFVLRAPKSLSRHKQKMTSLPRPGVILPTKHQRACHMRLDRASVTGYEASTGVALDGLPRNKELMLLNQGKFR